MIFCLHNMKQSRMSQIIFNFWLNRFSNSFVSSDIAFHCPEHSRMYTMMEKYTDAIQCNNTAVFSALSHDEANCKLHRPKLKIIWGSIWCHRMKYEMLLVHVRHHSFSKTLVHRINRVKTGLVNRNSHLSRRRLKINQQPYKKLLNGLCHYYESANFSAGLH